jgi:hypothetical protein
MLLNRGAIRMPTAMLLPLERSCLSVLQHRRSNNGLLTKAVHYNDWANPGKTDFQPVVAAFKVLTDLFQCDSCKSWLFVDNKHQPQGLRCA